MIDRFAADTPDDNPRELCVFLSSTFRDMQAERDYLIRHVFPEIRSICQQRGVTFTEIDLRWGITERHGEKKKIVRSCLDQLHRRRPVVISVIGSRYGWVPPIEELSDPRLLRLYPAIRKAAARGSSTVEIEIVEGVLNNPLMQKRAFFYFRDRSIETEKLEQSSSAQKRLDRLKQTIHDNPFPIRTAYTSLHMFGEWVRRDLLGVLDAEYPVERHGDPLLDERRDHDAFGDAHSRSYVEIPKYLQRLDSNADGDGPPMIVTGGSGMGKSALLAHWCKRYQEAHSGTFVIKYFVGAASSTGDRTAIMRYIMGEIGARYGETIGPLPKKPREIAKAFPYWLGQIQHEKLVIVIDGLNQLDEPSQHLDWLRHMPPRVRLIASTLEGPALDDARSYGWEELEVKPLTKKVRREIVKRYLADYGKEFTAKQLERIANDPASETALMLTVRLEELRLFGSHSELNDRITDYLSIENLDGLFDRVLERLEGDYTLKLVRSAMSLLWASRRGLSEIELLDLTGATRDELAAFLFAVDYHLSTFNGRRTFFHDYLRHAVSKRYLTGKNESDSIRKRAMVRKRIATYFADKPPEPRRIEEEPYQLKEAGAWPELIDCITDEAMFPQLSAEMNQYDLVGYVMAIGKPSLVFDRYRQALDVMSRRKGRNDDAIELANRVGNLALLAAQLDIAEEFITSALKKATRSNHADDRMLIEVLRNLGSLYLAQGIYKKAESHLQRALDHCRAEAVPAEVRAGVLDAMASLNYELKQSTAAVRHAGEAVEIRRRLYGNEHVRTISSMQDLAACLHVDNQNEQAELLLAETLRLCRRVVGTRRPLTAKLLNNLATVQMVNGYFDNAIEHLGEALDLNREIFSDEHTETAAAMINLGYALKCSANFPEAERLYRRAIEICERLLGDGHPVLTRHRVTLATVLVARGAMKEAAALSHKALEDRIRHLGTHHRDTLDAQLNVASVLYLMKSFDEALEKFDAYFAPFVEMCGKDHAHTFIYQERYANLLVDMNVETQPQPLAYLMRRSLQNRKKRRIK